MSWRRLEDEAEVGSALAGLVGTWEGDGAGEFPTIESFRYRERLEFGTSEHHPGAVWFDQRTWVVGGDGAEEPSHWESGFIVPGAAGEVRLLDTQPSGRAEILAGRALVDEGGGLRLELESEVQAGDDRVLATARSFRLEGDRLSYRLEMATQRVPGRRHHVAAELERTD